MKRFFILFFILLNSCSSISTDNEKQNNLLINVSQVQVDDSEASFDGNEQNSGIIDFIDGRGWLITKRAADRYLLLLNNFGNEEQKSIPNNGLTKDNINYILTQEGMVNFALLTQINKTKIK